MNDPQISLRIKGTRLSPGSQGLITIAIYTKSEEILVNPRFGIHISSGRTVQISPPCFVRFHLDSANHPDDIRQLLLSDPNTSLLNESLVLEISMAAADLGFGFNGFVLNVFVNVTYYHHTVDLGFGFNGGFGMNSALVANLNNNDTTDEVFRMVLEGKVQNEELESLKTESCSICLDDLYGSNPKKGLTRMSCSHVFHNRCLFEWLRRKNTCPLCRTVLYDRD